jgi:DNA repair photolyase
VNQALLSVAIEEIARAGIRAGISMLPILPGLRDVRGNLAAVRWAASHSGRADLFDKHLHHEPVHRRLASLPKQGTRARASDE